MGTFFNFASVQRIRIGLRSARGTDVTHTEVRYLDEDGVATGVDRYDCARIEMSIDHAGLFRTREIPTDGDRTGELALEARAA